MKLAANLSLLYPGLPLRERMAAAARDGFAGVEILFPYDVAPDELSSLLARHSLALALINTPQGSNGEKGLACLPGREAEFMKGLESALAVCRATGCLRIHVMAGIPDAGDTGQACRGTLIDNLRRAAPLAAEAGLTLTLEALNRGDMPGYFYHLPEQVADIIQAVGHEAVRLQFDLYHSQREGLDPPTELRRVLPLVAHVQLAHPEGRREPDLSDPAVRQALQILARSGYHGWVGCEYMPQGETSAGLGWRAAYHALVAAA